MPTIPSVLPVTWVDNMCVGRHPVQASARTWRSPSPARRALMSMSVRAISAVASVNTPGVLATGMPSSVATVTSMLL